jgi:hypothetical protein
MDRSTTEESLKQRETMALIAADKVEGTSVYDVSGNKLGSIERIMLDKISGRVAYAVMSFGGFLGIGDQHHPLPWSVLRYDPGTGGYVVNLDKDMLEGAPTIAANADFDWHNRDWNRRVFEYYHTSLY